MKISSGGTTMTLEQRIRGALRSAQPAPALRALVCDLAREGRAKPEILGLLDDFVVQQRTHADFREEDEEAVFDVLDALRGWCHPASELLPEKPGRSK
jgi:hypothetical protein